jgi:hypothetical protein
LWNFFGRDRGRFVFIFGRDRENLGLWNFFGRDRGAALKKNF